MASTFLYHSSLGSDGDDDEHNGGGGIRLDLCRLEDYVGLNIPLDDTEEVH